MNALVTGATGLLGGHLVRELEERGASVVALVRDWRPTALYYEGERRKKVEVRGDICDGRLIERVLSEYEIDTVFHLASQTQVRIADISPLSTWETNVRGTWIVLEACRSYGRCRKIVVASSDKCYGSGKPPYREDHPLDGIYPYDASKSCTDIIARSYAQTYALPVATVRCSNLYGPGDLNWRRIVPATMRFAFLGESLTLRGGGRMLRDYLYVADAVSGYLALADSRERGAFNFGTGKPTTIYDIVQAALRAAGCDRAPHIEPEHEHEIGNQWMDCAQARRILGWEPKTSVQDGLIQTVAWYKERLA